MLLPVSRSSFWPRLIGLSYERAVLWHRLASTFTLVATGVHGVHMVNDYGLQESFSTDANCFGYGNIYGTLILGAGGLLFVFAQAPVRRHSYWLFSMSHKVLVPAVLVLSCLHISNLVYFLLPSIILEVVSNRIGRKMRYEKPVRTASARIITAAAAGGGGGAGPRVQSGRPVRQTDTTAGGVLFTRALRRRDWRDAAPADPGCRHRRPRACTDAAQAPPSRVCVVGPQPGEL